jgi:hypothetical protein
MDISNVTATLFLSDDEKAIIQKIAILPNHTPTGIYARYLLQISTTGKNGLRPLIRTFDAEKMRVIQTTKDTDFMLFVPIQHKLASKIDAVKLCELFKSKQVFTPNLQDAIYVLNACENSQWINELKSTAKNNNVTLATSIIKEKTRAEFCDKNGNLQGVDWNFKDSYDTVKKLFSAVGINPREFMQFTDDVTIALNQSFIAGYTVKRIDDADEITQIYADKSVNIDSCMTRKETPARIYGNDYVEGQKSVALHAIYHYEQYVGRFVVRLKNNKYPSLYTSHDSDKIKNVLHAMGYECNPSALIGARLPLLTNENNNVYMVYVDGTDKDIRLIECDNGNRYLQVGGTKGDIIGTGNGTRGFLNINSHGRDKGFYDCSCVDYAIGYDDDDDDMHDDEFYCDSCNEWHDNQYYNNIDGNAICDDCRSEHYYSCDDCNDTLSIDDCYNLEVYDFNHDHTNSVTVCECCSNDYWQPPQQDDDGIHYRLTDLKRHVLGIR